MDLTSPRILKELLLAHHASPSKLMGQHFLISNSVLNTIIEAAQVNAKDTILEIGPGVGTLTQILAQNAKKVIAIEKDRAMVAILHETLKNQKNIEIIQQDALRYKIALKNYKLVANLPYHITSPIIRKFLEVKNQPEIMVLMVQKEVAQRICAAPGNMSILAVSVQFYASAKIISYVPKEMFWPKPKVDSAIIKIIPDAEKPPVPADLFFTVVKAGFLHPRKQLANNFTVSLKKSRESVHAWLMQNNIKPAQRAQTLSIKDWINLSKSF